MSDAAKSSQNSAVVTLAKDVMTPKPIILESSTDITAAVDIFTKNKISSVPVMTTMGEVAGQLTELVLVRIMVLFQLQPDKYRKLVNCQELLEPAYFVEPGDTMTTVLKTIMKSPSRRVLVKSAGRNILGIISPKDLMRVLMSDTEHAKAIQESVQKNTPTPTASS